MPYRPDSTTPRNTFDFHMSILLEGSPTNLAVFHSIMRAVDIDWPVSSSDSKYTKICKTCSGLIFPNPRVTPFDIKAAAKQAGIDCTIQRWAPEEKCQTGGNNPGVDWIHPSVVHRLLAGMPLAEAEALRRSEMGITHRHGHNRSGVVPLRPPIVTVVDANAIRLLAEPTKNLLVM